MKKIVILVLSLSFITLTACQSEETEAYEIRSTIGHVGRPLEDVVQASDLIISGAIIEKIDETQVKTTDFLVPNIKDHYETVSTYQVSVERVFRGSCEEEQIVVKYFGHHNLEAGQDCIFLLYRSSSGSETVYYPSYKVGILLPDETGNYSNRSVLCSEFISPETLPVYLKKLYSNK